MITISETAQKHFSKLLENQPEDTNIRVFVVNPGTPSAECGVSYCPPEAIESDDQSFDFSGFKALVDPESAPFLIDAVIDFEQEEMGAQLTLKAPNAKMQKVPDDAPLLERVRYVVETEVNPSLASHGGKISVLEITEEGFAIVQFGGGCNGCSQVDVTLKDGIEKQLLVLFEGELKGVKDVTEHEAGEHSYY